MVSDNYELQGQTKLGDSEQVIALFEIRQTIDEVTNWSFILFFFVLGTRKQNSYKAIYGG